MSLKVGDLYAEMSVDDGGFNSAMDRIEDSMQSAGRGMQQLGGNMTKMITGPLMAMAAGITKVGMDFEQQMSRVQGISGSTGDELESLEDTAREMGRSTSFSATQAAEGLEYMAMAGWETAEMNEALEPVLRMAESAQMDLGIASDITTDIMSAFGKEAEEAGMVTDILAAASTSANTDIEGLGEAMSYAAPQANALGFEMEETTAMIGLLADNGVKASQAGTTMNAMMRDLSNVSGDASSQMSEMGIEIFDAEGNMRSMTDIMHDMESATADMTDEEMKRFENMAGLGDQAMRGFNILLNEGAGELDQFAGELKESEGAVDEMGEATQDNLAYQLEELKSSIEGVTLDLAEGLVPVIRESVIPLVERAVDFISGMTQAFTNLSDSTQVMIIGAAGLAAALGPVLVATGTIVSAMSTLAPLLGIVAGAFGAISAPVVAAVSGVAAFASVAYLVYDNWTEVSDVLGAIWTYMGAQISNFVIGSQKSFYQLQSTVLSVVNNIVGRLAVLENLPFGVGEEFEGMRDSITDSADGANEKIEELGEKSEANSEKVKGASDDMSASFGEAGSAIGDTIDGVTDKINVFSGETEVSADVASDAGDEYIKAGEAAQDQADGVEVSTESTKENTEGTEENTEKTEENTKVKEENAEAEEELSDSKEREIARREQLEDRYSNKLRQATSTRVEQLEHEKEQSLEKAEELGASKKEIIDYYDLQIDEARAERREMEEENLEEHLTIKEEMRQDFNESIQQNASDTFEMMLDDLGIFEDTFIERNKYMNNFVTGVWNDMTASISSALTQNLSEIGSWVTSTVAQLGKAAAAYIKTAYSALVSYLSWMTFGAPAAAAAIIGTATAGIARIGADAVGLEEGGLVTGRTFAEIGEGSDQEAVIPLNSSVFGQLGEGIVANMPGGNSGSSGGNKTVNITVELDGRTIAKATKQPLVDELRIKGVKV